MSNDDRPKINPDAPKQSQPVSYRSVAELCADYPELAEYIAQMEGDLLTVLRAATDDLKARDACRCDDDMLHRNMRTIADTRLREVLSSMAGYN